MVVVEHMLGCVVDTSKSKRCFCYHRYTRAHVVGNSVLELLVPFNLCYQNDTVNGQCEALRLNPITPTLHMTCDQDKEP